jgi:hypothetical protein
VDVTVLPAQETGGIGDLIQSLIFPVALFAGLFFLSRRAAGGGAGGFGGPNNPMNFGKSKAQIQMVPDTGVTFDGMYLLAFCLCFKYQLQYLGIQIFLIFNDRFRVFFETKRCCWM